MDEQIAEAIVSFFEVDESKHVRWQRISSGRSKRPSAKPKRTNAIYPVRWAFRVAEIRWQISWVPCAMNSSCPGCVSSQVSPCPQSFREPFNKLHAVESTLDRLPLHWSSRQVWGSTHRLTYCIWKIAVPYMVHWHFGGCKTV